MNCCPAQFRGLESAARYALARHVPELYRGFVVETVYGPLALTAEEVAEHPEILHGIRAVLQERVDAAARAAGVL